MITINKIAKDDISELTRQYSQKITAPLDDMWENAIIPGGDYYLISKESAEVGYFVIDENATLLQFFIVDSVAPHSREIFEFILKEKNIPQAFAGTFEPDYLSLCLDKQIKAEVDTLLYKESQAIEFPAPIESIHSILATMDDYEAVLNFCEEKVGIQGEWMKPYYQHLLPNKSVTLFKLGDEIIGAGECRPSQSNNAYANVGIMVSADYRKRQLGTYIMSQMRKTANENGRKAICSTTIDNIGSQKAITNSGFYAYHRILKITFPD